MTDFATNNILLVVLNKPWYLMPGNMLKINQAKIENMMNLISMEIDSFIDTRINLAIFY